MSDARTPIIVALIGMIGVVAAAYVAHMPAGRASPDPKDAGAAETAPPHGELPLSVAGSAATTSRTAPSPPTGRSRIDPKVLGATDWVDQDGRRVEVRVYPGRILVAWQGAPNLVFHGSQTEPYRYAGDTNDPDHPNCAGGFDPDAALRLDCPGLKGKLSLVMRTASS